MKANHSVWIGKSLIYVGTYILPLFFCHFAHVVFSYERSIMMTFAWLCELLFA